MRLRSIVLTVVEELRRRDIEVSYDVAKLVIQLALEVVQRETSKGSTVYLDGFGRFKPRLQVRGGVPFWRIYLKMSQQWRSLCIIHRKGEIPRMDKYAYEKEQEDPKVKTAAEKGRCPKCGAEVQGNPPVCPTHGSEPFERREDGEGQG